jgi:hypothetical protein
MLPRKRKKDRIIQESKNDNNNKKKTKGKKLFERKRRSGQVVFKMFTCDTNVTMEGTPFSEHLFLTGH